MATILKARSGYRDVSIEFSNASTIIDGNEVAQVAAPIDAFKAAIHKVENMEGRYARLGAAGVPDLAAKDILVTGTLPEEIFKFTVTSTMATGVYQFLFVEIVDPATLS